MITRTKFGLHYTTIDKWGEFETREEAEKARGFCKTIDLYEVTVFIKPGCIWRNAVQIKD